MKNILSSLTDRSILISLLLGFSSALPLALTGSTLQAWYAKTSTVSLVSIGFVGLAGLPYTFKFLWAPFMDRFLPPFLGRRRGWIVVCQLALGVFIMTMASLSPSENPNLLLGIAFIVAFLSASQDIAIDAYRADLLKPENRAMGAAMGVNGYRIAMLVSGGLALVLADYLGWRFTYLVMGFLLLLNVLTAVLGPEPKLVGTPPPRNIVDCIIQPFFDFLSRPQAIAILFFVVFYKLGDAFAGSMCQTFLIRKVQMSLSEIGTIIKFFGFIGTVTGTLVGALWIPKLGWLRALYVFGILQVLANLLFMPLIWTGPNYLIAGSAIFADNFFGGMGTAAFVGLLMGLCNPRFTAFQFALLSSLSSVGRVFISPIAGGIAASYGWEAFFAASLVFAVPGLLLLSWIKNDFQWNITEAQGNPT